MAEDRLVILVEFLLHEQGVDEFRKLIDANAAASVRDEPGCRQFDVAIPEDDPRRVVLYEIYDDAAFDAHRRTPHFLEFNEKSAPLVAEKTARRLRLR